MSRWRSSLEWRSDEVRDRFGVLLILLVASFIALGSTDRWARALAALLQLAALVVAFLATRLARDHRVLAALSVSAVLSVLLTGVLDRSGVPAGIGEAASFVVLLAILVAVLDRVLRHRRVTLQTLFGAVCAYFLIGLMFSSLYGVLDAFSTEPIFGEAVARSVYSYFSFTTLTTVGFGDYTVKTNLARRIVVLEAVLGQVFIATALARLVSLYRSPPSEA